MMLVRLVMLKRFGVKAETGGPLKQRMGDQLGTGPVDHVAAGAVYAGRDARRVRPLALLNLHWMLLDLSCGKRGVLFTSFLVAITILNCTTLHLTVVIC